MDRFYAAAIGIVLFVLVTFVGLVVTTAFHGLSASVTAPPPARAEVHRIPNPLAGCGCCERCRCGR